MEEICELGGERSEVLRQILDGIQDIICVQLPDHTILSFNRAGYDFLGKGPDDIIGMKCYHMMGRETECPQCATRLALQSRRLEGIVKYIPQIGAYLDCRSKPILDEDGNIGLIVEQIRDITDMKLGERALLESETRFRASIDTLIEGFAILSAVRDTDGRIVDLRFDYINEAGCRLSRMAREEIIGQNLLEIMPSHKESGLFDECRRIIETGEPLSRETVFYDGMHGRGREAGFFELRAMKLEDGITVAWKDITDKKRAEEDLRWNEELLRSMADNSPLAFYVVDNRTDSILYFNRRFCEIWSLGEIEERMKRGEMKNNDIIPLLVPNLKDVPTFAAGCKPLQDEDNRVVVEDEIEFADGRTIRRFSAQIRDSEDSYFGRLYIFEDITERKATEERLKASLDEKEMVLRETHQRVRNNLQVVSSLMLLQSACIKDEAAVGVLKECQNRVKSMALVHQNIYESESLDRVNFAGYIKTLASYISASCGIKGRGIRLKMDLDDVCLGVDAAIPCGLIINELVSNCIKHAFPDGRGGTITIEFQAAGRDRATLIIGDDGIGLPEGIDVYRSDSMGLKLVSALVKQLRGSIDVRVWEGTLFEISFPLGASDPRSS